MDCGVRSLRLLLLVVLWRIDPSLVLPVELRLSRLLVHVVLVLGSSWCGRWLDGSDGVHYPENVDSDIDGLGADAEDDLDGEEVCCCQILR